MTDLWYPVCDRYPGPTVKVWGIVTLPGGVQDTFDAQVLVARGIPPHGDKWAQWDRIGPKPLPPGSQVRWFRPQDPAKWKAPLPEPVIEREGRMWSARTGFALVDEAEAAELAAEMEADRNDARRGAGQDRENREAIQWWRDADKIRYEPAGQITPRMAEGRIMRALTICESGKGLTLPMKSFGTILAQMSAHADQHAYATSDYVPKMRPLPADHTDFQTAMTWFIALDPKPVRDTLTTVANWECFTKEQEVLLYRARNIPPSFGEIAGWIGLPRSTTHAMYEKAVLTVTKFANGVSVNRSVSAQITALRDRNMAWKRKGHDPVSIHECALSALKKQRAT